MARQPGRHQSTSRELGVQGASLDVAAGPPLARYEQTEHLHPPRLR